MSTRIYFLVDDEAEAKKVITVLRNAEVEEDNIIAVAKREKYPLAEGIPEANLLERSDVVNAAKNGSMIGGATGFFAGLAAVSIMPLGLIAAGGAALGMGLAGATLGTWTSTMIGVSVTNRDLKAFEDGIEEGRILMLVDVDKAKADTIKAAVRKAQPEALIGSGTLNDSENKREHSSSA